MSNENNIENNEEQNVELKTDKKFLLKILIIFILILIIFFGCFFIYKKYEQYDFQKRYKNAPVGSIIRTSDMNYPRSNHSCIKLRDGNVLVVGGNKGAEIFYPKTGQYKLINSKLEEFNGSRLNSILLPNGNILVAGYYLFNAETYKFKTVKNVEKFINKDILNMNSMQFIIPIVLSDNKVLIIVDNNSNIIENKTLIYNISDNSYEEIKMNIHNEYKKYMSRGLSYIKKDNFINFIIQTRNGMNIIKWDYNDNKILLVKQFDKSWQQTFIIDEENILLNDGFTGNSTAIYNIKYDKMISVDGLNSHIYKVFNTNNIYIFASEEKEKYYDNAKHSIQIYTINLNDKKYINQNIKNLNDFYSSCFQYLYHMESICNYDKNNFLISGGQIQTPLNTRVKNSIIVKLGGKEND